jgi:cytochrome c oxidase subunit II
VSRNFRSFLRAKLVALQAGVIAGCDGPQSALEPAGYDAAKLAELFWIMTIGSAVIWAVVMGLAFYAVKRTDPPAGAANLLIIGGGIVFPLVVLTALLIYGLVLLTSLRATTGVV